MTDLFDDDEPEEPKAPMSRSEAGKKGGQVKQERAVDHIQGHPSGRDLAKSLRVVKAGRHPDVINWARCFPDEAVLLAEYVIEAWEDYDETKRTPDREASWRLTKLLRRLGIAGLLSDGTKLETISRHESQYFLEATIRLAAIDLFVSVKDRAKKAKKGKKK